MLEYRRFARSFIAFACASLLALHGACTAPNSVAAEPALPIQSSASIASADFSGRWNSSYGLLVIQQSGASVIGRYSSGEGGEGDAGDDGVEGRITGKIDGRRLVFDYIEPDDHGEGWFELATDGRSFTGKWKPAHADEWSVWTGERPEPASFTGTWNTSFGPMRLRISGERCAGTYLFNGLSSHIAGTVAGDKFTFGYDQPDGEKGEGWFALDVSGDAFSGKWKVAGATSEKPWTGSRMDERSGSIHLVVLEANWEQSLSEREYSYGEILRSFFQRIPSVRFHYRSINSLDDVRRFAGEVAYLPGPVILYFSSHGSAAGISVGSTLVTPEQIAAAVHGADNILVLHFGACEVMAGDAPRKLLAALEDTKPFPISGYANSADWGGSAIIDMTYLDYMLEHGLAPARAIEETVRSLSFASERGEHGAISPCLLRIFEPIEH